MSAVDRKPRISVVLEHTRAAVLRRFASRHGITLSELVAAIVEPVTAAMVAQLADDEEDQPTLFPDALVSLYEEEDFSGGHAVDHLLANLEHLRRERFERLQAARRESEDRAEDAATAAPGGRPQRARRRVRKGHPTPGSNTGVTSTEPHHEGTSTELPLL